MAASPAAAWWDCGRRRAAGEPPPAAAASGGAAAASWPAQSSSASANASTLPTRVHPHPPPPGERLLVAAADVAAAVALEPRNWLGDAARPLHPVLTRSGAAVTACLLVLASFSCCWAADEARHGCNGAPPPTCGACGGVHVSDQVLQQQLDGGCVGHGSTMVLMKSACNVQCWLRKHWGRPSCGMVCVDAGHMLTRPKASVPQPVAIPSRPDNTCRMSIHQSAQHVCDSSFSHCGLGTASQRVGGCKA